MSRVYHDEFVKIEDEIGKTIFIKIDKILTIFDHKDGTYTFDTVSGKYMTGKFLGLWTLPCVFEKKETK